MKRIKPLSGGVANDVWEVRVGGRRAVARLGHRSDADLAWEAGLIQHLNSAGVTVPLPIPTEDNRLYANGLTVMEYIEGEPPVTHNDWVKVAGVLQQVHAATAVWPQRPGWRSSLDLAYHSVGTKIDLTRMPPEGVARCRAAWARNIGRATCVVHGNPNNPNNIRITKDRVGLIDWDEAHVDVPDLDLALPGNPAGFDAERLDIAMQASAAWEAAVCWGDDYAVQRLAQVRS